MKKRVKLTSKISKLVKSSIKPWCISFKQDWECLVAYPLKQVIISISFWGATIWNLLVIDCFPIVGCAVFLHLSNGGRMWEKRSDNFLCIFLPYDNGSSAVITLISGWIVVTHEHWFGWGNFSNSSRLVWTLGNPLKQNTKKCAMKSNGWS